MPPVLADKFVNKWQCLARASCFLEKVCFKPDDFPCARVVPPRLLNNRQSSCVVTGMMTIQGKIQHRNPCPRVFFAGLNGLVRCGGENFFCLAAFALVSKR